SINASNNSCLYGTFQRRLTKYKSAYTKLHGKVSAYTNQEMVLRKILAYTDWRLPPPHYLSLIYTHYLMVPAERAGIHSNFRGRGNAVCRVGHCSGSPHAVRTGCPCNPDDLWRYSFWCK